MNSQRRGFKEKKALHRQLPLQQKASNCFVDLVMSCLFVVLWAFM